MPAVLKTKANPPMSSPTTAVVEVANVCNFLCPQCAYVPPTAGGNFMNVDLFGIVALGARLAGTQRIRFLGLGEPTLHPNFDRILLTARENRLETHVISNGSFVFRAEARRRLLIGATELEVSLDAADGGTYTKYRGKSAGYFRRLNTELRRFFEENRDVYQRICVSFVSHPDSDQEFERFVETWTPVVDVIRRRAAHSFNGHSRMISNSMSRGIHREQANDVHCGFHFDRFFVDRFGSMAVCNLDRLSRLGLIREPEDVGELWAGALRRSLVVTGNDGRCKACERCSGLD